MSDQPHHDDIDPDLQQALKVIKSRDRELTVLQARIDRIAEDMKASLPVVQAIGREGVDQAAKTYSVELVFRLAGQACLYTFASLEVVGMRSQLDLLRSFLESPPQDTDPDAT